MRKRPPTSTLRDSVDAKRPTLQLEADDHTFLHVTWGRSGKRAIVSIAGSQWSEPRQCTVTPEAASELARFLEAGPDDD